METITINIDEYNLLKEQKKTLEDIFHGNMKIITNLREHWLEEKEKNKKLKKDLDIIHKELWSCDSEYDGKIDESVDNIKAAMNAAFLNTTYIAYLERIRDEDFDGIIHPDC
tara:strand:+ start:228 stop:563 length:336 start_codon:yes stop_codon:yes gene_type:complete